MFQERSNLNGLPNSWALIVIFFYKQGCDNKVVDAFSRKMTFCALFMVHLSELEKWEIEVQVDP